MIKKIAAALLALALAASPALAGSGTIQVTPGTGATYQVITNGGGNFVGMFGLCDGVAAAQCVAVKAASTAAGATDPALVVAISPNNSVAVTGTFWQSTQPVSAVSLPLPAGAATSALQSTINATLGSPFQAGGSIGNTTFASTQSGVWTVQPGNTANTTPWLFTLGSGGVQSGAFAAGSIASGAAVSGAFAAGSIADLAHGQGTMAASVPVAIANNQSAVQISAASLPLPTGAATAALQTGQNFGGYDFQLAPTITVQNAAYSAGNSEGGLITVTGAARTNGGTGILDGIRLKSNGAATNTIWIYAWSKTPAATCTDKSAYVASTSDTPFALVGFPVSVVLGGAPGAWDTSTYAQLTNQVSNFKNQDTSPGTAIYLCLVTAGSVTPGASSDLSIIVAGVQD